MNRKRWTIGASLSLMVALAVGTAGVAAQSKPTAASSDSPAPAVKTTKPQSSPMTPVRSQQATGAARARQGTGSNVVSGQLTAAAIKALAARAHPNRDLRD